MFPSVVAAFHYHLTLDTVTASLNAMDATSAPAAVVQPSSAVAPPHVLLQQAMVLLTELRNSNAITSDVYADAALLFGSTPYTAWLFVYACPDERVSVLNRALADHGHCA